MATYIRFTKLFTECKTGPKRNSLQGLAYVIILISFKEKPNIKKSV